MRISKQVTITSFAGICAALLISSQVSGSGPATTAKPVGAVVVPAKSYQPREADGLSERGKDIYTKLDCAQCHSISNVGGNVGPMLDGVGAHRNEEFLLARLSKDSGAIEKFKQLTAPNSQEMFDHPRVGVDRVYALVAYLKTLPEPAGGFRVTAHPKSEEDKDRAIGAPYKPASMTESALAGQKLYQQMGCAQCHMIGGIGGYLGPKLDGIGGVHGKDYIVAHVTNARAVAMQNSEISKLVQTPMPKFESTINAKDAASIADFLMTLPEW